jgi:hyperosmotically inducible protein
MKPHISLKVVSAVALSAGLITAYAASPSHQAAGQSADDSATTTKVKSELFGSKKASPSDDVSVKTVDGVVHLSGFTRSQDEKERAARIALSVTGASQVDNEIKVEPAGFGYSR